MSKSRRKFDKSYKLKALELSELRGSVSEVAEELGINPNILYRWRRELSDGKDSRSLSRAEEQLVRLERELKEAKLERDILKKALGIFSKSDGKSINS